MSEHRQQILQMLSQGQITVEEAENLIAALEKEPASDATPKVKAKLRKSCRVRVMTASPSDRRRRTAGR